MIKVKNKKWGFRRLRMEDLVRMMRKKKWRKLNFKIEIYKINIGFVINKSLFKINFLLFNLISFLFIPN